MATQLTSPTGATVSVDDAKVEGLLSRGFIKAETKKSTPKKSTSGSKK